MAAAMPLCKCNNTEETVICKKQVHKNLSTLHIRSGSKCWLGDKIGNNSEEYYASEKLQE